MRYSVVWQAGDAVTETTFDDLREAVAWMELQRAAGTGAAIFRS